MSVNLVFHPSLSPVEKNICCSYWEYKSNDNYLGYLAHIKLVCQQYKIQHQDLFKVLSRCHAYVSDVQCQYCGLAAKVDFPADIPHVRSEGNWFCRTCETVVSNTQ